MAYSVPGFAKRGRLQPGAFADITIFDFNEIRCGGTVRNPGVPSNGIITVIVNGVIVYEQRHIQDVSSGKLIKRGQLE